MHRYTTRERERERERERGHMDLLDRPALAQHKHFLLQLHAIIFLQT
jgi:hypothetical protein